MKESKIHDCSLIKLDSFEDEFGCNSIVEFKDSIPFEIKRIYFLYEVPRGQIRGGHAHKDLQQLIIPVSGCFKVKLNDSETTKTFTLNKPNKGLFLVSGIWREIMDFSSGSVCLVIASDVYIESDYIRNINDFIDYKNDT